MERLVNTTTGTLVAAEVRRADNFLTRAIGLLGQRRLDEQHALWLEPCRAVHTFLLSYPIDVAFLAADGEVLQLHRALLPWSVAGPARGARVCVELAAGTLDRTGVRRGQRLALMQVRGPPKGRFTGRRGPL